MQHIGRTVSTRVLIGRLCSDGDYETLCPQQTFTYAALQKSFPGSTEQPWTLLQQFGPTASGLEGFIATIPGTTLPNTTSNWRADVDLDAEMDKVVITFKGLYGWETLYVPSSSRHGLQLIPCLGFQEPNSGTEYASSALAEGTFA